MYCGVAFEIGLIHIWSYITGYLSSSEIMRKSDTTQRDPDENDMVMNCIYSC